MKALHDWFFQNKRDFPWRQNPTPYRVWVSEVMLQQTRATVVVSYFERWMSLFPDIQALAAAPLSQVIKAWEGLGYYARARNLHQGAQQIVEQFGGEIPGDASLLKTIRGLGPYTIGAILSFGFRQRAVAIDGNVTRVLARLFAIEQRIDQQAVKQLLVQKTESLLDREMPWVTTEALIELGATLCTPKPVCAVCPLSGQCLALTQGKAELLPLKKEAPKTTVLRRAVGVIEAEGAILVKQEQQGKVMAGLYEFPYFEMGKERWGMRKVAEEVAQLFNLEVQVIQKLPEEVHTFTRYKAHLFPTYLRAAYRKAVPGYEWVSRHSLGSIPFSAGHKKILRRIP